MINQISHGVGNRPKIKKFQAVNRSKMDSVTQSFEMGLDLVRDAFIQMRQLKVSNHSKCEETISDLENKLIHAHSRIDNLSRQIQEEKKLSEELERRNRNLLETYREAEVFREKLFRMIQQQESQFNSRLQKKTPIIPTPSLISENEEADVNIQSPKKPQERLVITNTPFFHHKDFGDTSPVISPIVKRRVDEIPEKYDRYSSVEGLVRNLDEEAENDEKEDEEDPHEDFDEEDDEEIKQHDFDLKLDLESDCDADAEESDEIREETSERLNIRLEIDPKINELYPSVLELDSHKREMEERSINPRMMLPPKDSSYPTQPTRKRSERKRLGSVGNSIAEAEELYAKVKRELSTSQFRMFAINIKKLNSEEISQEDTLRNIKKIFGVQKLLLFRELERLVKDKE